jgi:hypothetical protein
MKLLFLLCIFCVGVSCSNTKNIPAELPFTFQLKNYGEATATVIIRDSVDYSPSGLHSYIDDFKIIKTTDTISLRKGVRFGVEYSLQSTSKTTIHLFAEWVFPKKIRNNQNKVFKKMKYETSRGTNEVTFSAYRIEEDFEAVAGKWIFRLYYNDRIVYQRQFILK